jgi:hypothetical protein
VCLLIAGLVGFRVKVPVEILQACAGLMVQPGRDRECLCIISLACLRGPGQQSGDCECLWIVGLGGLRGVGPAEQRS